MDRIKIGVIGAGRIGKLHIENILQHFVNIQIKSVADPYADASWMKKNAHLHFTRVPDTVINDAEIEAVLICSPSTLHATHIIQSARAGKHIFCEKPISTDLDQIKNILQEVQKAGVKFQVGYNRRFDPNFAKIKQMIVDDAIGSPHLLRITSRDPKIPPADFLKTSGGLFLDMTIHDFDMASFLMNSQIQEIYATGTVLVDPIFSDYNDIDTAIINLKFANGALGVIDNSRQAVYGYDQRIEVFGSKGAVFADNNKPTNTSLSTADGISFEKPLYYFLERYKESFINELQEFFNSITNDIPCSVTGKDGLISIIAAQAAQQSLRENRPIKLTYEQWMQIDE